MKSTELKKFIKDAVREAIQEELKDILLEAVRSPKQVVRESFSPTVPVQPAVNPSFTPPTMDFRSKYAEALGETAMSFTSNDVNKFNPRGADPLSGNLPGGELGMDQSMGLLNTK